MRDRISDEQLAVYHHEVKYHSCGSCIGSCKCGHRCKGADGELIEHDHQKGDLPEVQGIMGRLLEQRGAARAVPVLRTGSQSKGGS